MSQTIDYWNPAPDPEQYGRLFKAAAPAIRAADPGAKIIFGGLAGADRRFAKRALDACACGESIDVFAYHIYPDYGHNLNPEAMDDERHADESPKARRNMVRGYAGIRNDLVFWNDEFNSIPSWERASGCSEGTSEFASAGRFLYGRREICCWPPTGVCVVGSRKTPTPYCCQGMSLIKRRLGFLRWSGSNRISGIATSGRPFSPD